MASRVEPLALLGGICLTDVVHSSVINKLKCVFESLGSPQLKNVIVPIEVFRIAGYGQGDSLTAQSKTQPPTDRVAVLPMRSISPDPDDEYFADGMTEELISSLSKLKGLRIIARTSVMRYKQSDKPISEIEGELNAGTILKGSVRKVKNKIRLQLSLSTNQKMSYDGPTNTTGN